MTTDSKCQADNPNNNKSLIKDRIETNNNNNNNNNNKLSIYWRARSPLQVPVAKPLRIKIKNATIQILLLLLLMNYYYYYYYYYLTVLIKWGGNVIQKDARNKLRYKNLSISNRRR